MIDLNNDLFAATHGFQPWEHPNWLRQQELEEEMRSAGVARFRAQLEANRDAGRESQSGGARRLMVHAHEQVVAGLQAFLEECESGRPGRRHTAYTYLVGTDLDMVAHLTLRSLFDTVSMRKRVATTANRIATLIEDELYFDAFKEKDERHYQSAKKKIVRQSSNPVYQKRVMSKHARNQQVEWEEWSNELKIKIGTKLVEIVVETTGLFSLVRQSEGTNNTNIYVTASEQVLTWLRTENARQECMSPVYLPTIVPPRPWTSATKGGYWSGRVRNLRLIKTHNKAYLDDLESCDMSTVFKAVNAMQETAWARSTCRVALSVAPPASSSCCPVNPLSLPSRTPQSTS